MIRIIKSILKVLAIFFTGYLDRDPNNPYTFHCRYCGQVFNTYGFIGYGNDWLEFMGKIQNKKCGCRNWHGRQL